MNEKEYISGLFSNKLNLSNLFYNEATEIIIIFDLISVRRI